MLYLSSLFTTLLMLVAVTAVGLRVCELLPPRLRPIGRGYFSPLIGLSVFIPLATALGWVHPFSFAVCGGVTCSLTLFSLWRTRRWKPLLPLLAAVLTFGAVASLSTMAALLRFDGFNSMNDAFTYLVHGQWLQTHAFSEAAAPSGFHPAATQVAVYQNQGHRMGASFFLAWFQAAFHFDWSYEAYSAAVALPLLTGALATGGVVRLVARRGRVMPAVIALITATTLNGWVFGSSYGFFPQTFGLAFASGALSLIGAGLSLRTGAGSRQAWGPWLVREAKGALPVALVLSAFVFTYNDLLSFVALAVAIFVAGMGIRSRPTASRMTGWLAIVLIETLAIVNIEVVRILRTFLNTALNIASGRVQFGWPVLWPQWEFVALAFGLRHATGDTWLFVGKWVTALVLALVIVGIATAMILRVRSGRMTPPVVLHGLLLTIFCAAFLYFRYAVPGFDAHETGNTFIQFKIAKWASVSALALFGIAANDWSRRGVRSWILVSACTIAVALGIGQNLVVADAMTGGFVQLTGRERGGFTTLIELRNWANTLPPEDIIYLDVGSQNHKLRQLMTYVLWDRKVSSDYNDDGYIAGFLPTADRNMPYAPTRWLVEYAPPDLLKPAALPRAGNLVIRPRPAVRLSPPSATGGFGRESDARGWWEWTEQSITIHFDVLGVPTRGRVRFLYQPTAGGLTLAVTMKGASETSFTLPMAGGWNEFVGPPIDVDPPSMSITFTSDRPGTLTGTDPRRRAFLVGNVSMEPVDVRSTRENAKPVDAWQERQAPELLEASGGYNIEREGAATWRYWTGKELEFRYRVPDYVRGARFKFTYLPAMLGLTLTVRVEGPGGSFTLPLKGGWNDYVSDIIPVSGPDLKVTFLSNGEAVRMGPQDPRMVKFLIQNLEVIPADASP